MPQRCAALSSRDSSPGSILRAVIPEFIVVPRSAPPKRKAMPAKMLPMSIGKLDRQHLRRRSRPIWLIRPRIPTPIPGMYVQAIRIPALSSCRLPTSSGKHRCLESGNRRRYTGGTLHCRPHAAGDAAVKRRRLGPKLKEKQTGTLLQKHRKDYGREPNSCRCVGIDREPQCRPLGSCRPLRLRHLLYGGHGKENNPPGWQRTCRFMHPRQTGRQAPP